MPTLIIEFDLPPDPIIMTETGNLYLELSNGVVLKTTAPVWVQSIKSVKLMLEMEVLGSPSDANVSKPPVE